MKSFCITLHSDAPAYVEQQVILIARGFDVHGEPAGYFSTEQRPSQLPHTTTLECPGCARIDLYLYIIPHTLPTERDIYEVPALEATLTLHVGRKKIHQEQLLVNPWGGLNRTLHFSQEGIIL